MVGQTIIITSPGFPKDEQDTTCLTSQQLFVLGLKRLYPLLTVIVVALQYPYHANPYRWNGIHVFPLGGKNQKGISRVLLWFRAFILLNKLTREKEVLGMISFWCNEAALISKYFASVKKINHKIWICGQDARADNYFVRWIKPKPIELVAMSDFLKKEFEKNHGIQVGHTVYNGVAATFTNAARDVDVMAAGSLIPLKRYNIFLDIVAALRKKNRKTSAVLFGKGEEDTVLRQQLQTLQLQENLQITDEVDHDTLMHWMNRARIFVHTSEYEGYSTVCLEALANGCQVVSFTSAEDKPVENWHIVQTKDDMIEKIRELLLLQDVSKPVLIRDMQDSVRQMIALFDR